jgi:biotin synthase
MPVDEVVAAAKAAKDKGASRFCMGAAWKGPKDNDLDRVLEMVREVKALGMQTCVTLGMLKDGQAEKLKEAGLDYYNHNLDTDKEFYGQVIKTHTHDDRLDTLDQVRDAGINVCSGGIIGMGESRKNRAGLIVQLANLPKPPESVPINNLVPIPGTPLADNPRLDPFEFVRTIAAARITMPTSWVRLSAGRQEMSDELQAMCFWPVPIRCSMVISCSPPVTRISSATTPCLPAWASRRFEFRIRRPATGRSTFLPRSVDLP